MTKSQTTGYLPTLDGWRAVAILGVMIAHAGSAIFHPGGPHPNVGAYELTRYGAMGVDLFFAISGLLICSRLLEEQQRLGHISLKRFYIRRACRIVPPYVAVLTVLALLATPGLLTVSRSEWISCLLFARNYLPDYGPERWYTGHFWSLAIEEHFYLLWPGLLVLLSPARARRWVVVMALSLAVWRHIEFQQQALSRVMPGVAFYERTDIRLDALLWGSWVALLLPLRGTSLAFGRMLRIGSSGFTFATVIITCTFAMPGLAIRSAAIPFMLAATLTYPNGITGRVLESAPLRWIGRLSYSLYLWQQLFLVGGDVLRPLPFPRLQEWPWNLPAVVVCAIASYYAIERPMIALGHRLAKPATPGRLERAVPAHLAGLTVA